MGKRLPYFQFEPAEWLAGNIMFCSLEAQGLYSNIMALYWQKDCVLSHSQIIKRFNRPELLKELLDEKIISVSGDEIEIKFLKNQLDNYEAKSSVNQANGKKGGRPKNQIKTETKPKQNPTDNPIKTETKALREDKRIGEEIREDNIVIIDNSRFSEDCKTSSQWIETVAMQSRVKTEAIIFFMDNFESHLITMQEQKKTLKDFKEHFSHWLRKQDLSSFAVKSIGKTNQI